jgi:putative tricarboxylic transport membrane protein
VRPGEGIARAAGPAQGPEGGAGPKAEGRPKERAAHPPARLNGSEKAGPLAVAAGVVGLGLFFLLGAFRIPGEAQYAGVGPRAFPMAVGGALVVLGATLGVALWRGMVIAPEAGEDVDASRRADLRPVAWIVAGLALSVVLLERAGFPLTAALVFTLTARGFGSRRLVRDALVGLALAVATFLVFARGLGVSLPGGPFLG